LFLQITAERKGLEVKRSNQAGVFIQRKKNLNKYLWATAFLYLHILLLFSLTGI